MRQRGFAAIIFLIGCATGGVASRLVVPPVRAGTAPTRWEYTCILVADQLSSSMNSLGAQGWELVTAFPTYYDPIRHDATAFTLCSKRALP